MTTDTNRNNIRTFDLWLSLASGPLLWAAYHSLIYAISSLACQKGFWLNPVLGPFSTLTLVLLGIALVVLLLMAFAGYRAYTRWKDLRGGDPTAIDHPERTRPGFMVFSALALNILFGAATLVTFLPTLYFEPCS